MYLFFCLQVFYLDYGNCSFVKASQVYKWDAMWSSIPFRAYLCHLNGVKKVRNIDYLAINYFKEIALSKELQATILYVNLIISFNFYFLMSSMKL